MGDLSGQVIYAMRVSRRFTMREYDEFCRVELRGKLPDWGSRYFKKRMGDCIYDFAGQDEPRLRRSVHREKNRETDLSGHNVLLSDHFFYFGNRPHVLPNALLAIVQQTQGHRSWANAPYVDAFVEWIASLKLKPSRLYGEPIEKVRFMRSRAAAAMCSAHDCEADLKDEVCF
jgi:hypothetical protein